MAISSSVTLGGSEAPGVTKPQDLTKSCKSESLAAVCPLMKLMDGRWVIGEESPGRLAPKWWGCDPQMTGFSTDERLTVQFPLRPLVMGWEVTASSGGPSIRCRFQTGRLMAGFCSRGTREGACRRMTQPVESGDYKKGANKIIHCTFLACWVTRHCLSSPRRRLASAATCFRVASPVSKTANVALA
ncbi:hypothetical protein Cgig2_009017 [Carnegiea gigantea]|uniref:Uncharacterized protein n=1 Tax=Carnegiea gigantea TaxID=171969 RepID=A0A9Q1KF84_9CARY|nr:hypothetical protein Cgig2_009017 [Carnegiea gigantea]